MTWKENMYAAVAQMLRENYGIDAVTVTDFEDYTEYGGYCETCAYEETRCTITYTDTEGDYKTYSYYGSFSELIGALS